MCSSAPSDPAVPRGHENPGGGKGGDPLQVLWSSTHQLHLAEVQETGETHTGARVIVRWFLLADLCISCFVCDQIQEGSGDISIESTDNSSKLTISSGQQDHCGCYTIELRNSYGLRQAALNLTIVGEKHLLLLFTCLPSPGRTKEEILFTFVEQVLV